MAQSGGERVEASPAANSRHARRSADGARGQKMQPESRRSSVKRDPGADRKRQRMSAHEVASLLNRCSCQLHQLWQRFAARGGDEASWMLERFNRRGLHSQDLLNPCRAHPPMLIPAAEVLSATTAALPAAAFGSGGHARPSPRLEDDRSCHAVITRPSSGHEGSSVPHADLQTSDRHEGNDIHKKAGEKGTDQGAEAKRSHVAQEDTENTCPNSGGLHASHRREATAGVGVVRPARSLDSVARDMAFGSLPHCHALSERHRPHENDVLASITATDREMFVAWLLQACASMDFRSSIAHSAVLFFDRHCEAWQGPLIIDHLQVVVLSVLSIALKFNGPVEIHVGDPYEPPIARALDHLSQARVPVRAVLEKEREILEILGFEISAPTALDFLDFLMASLDGALGVQRQQRSALPYARCLGMFLLELALLDVSFCHRYPHALLAAAALDVSLWHRGADVAQREAVLSIVSHVCC